jgi:hypothetical protein
MMAAIVAPVITPPSLVVVQLSGRFFELDSPYDDVGWVGNWAGGG